MSASEWASINDENEELRDNLEQAKQLLREVRREMKHDDGCLRQQFVNDNRYIPPGHPVWASAPECNCAVRAVDIFLNKFEQQ